MGITDLRFGAPPGGRETARGRQAGCGRSDEWIDLGENGQTLGLLPAPGGYTGVNVLCRFATGAGSGRRCLSPSCTTRC